jgi:diaminohydroxyphosphoribosylaminopyrimidine deaminase/5-amino-6-(5-phosphoribosylamino)uracil reductase
VITIAGQEIPDGAEVVAVAADAGGRPDLDAAVDALSERGLLYLLLEGGSTLSHLMWSRQLIDRGIFYLGGMLAGGVGRPVFDAPWTTLGGARPIEIVDVVRLGPDLRVEWLPAPQPS